MATHGLVMPFLDDDPKFAHGVEFGMLYVRMRDTDEDEISDLFLIDNQEQILVAASRMGWCVTKIEDSTPGWFYCRMQRNR